MAAGDYIIIRKHPLGGFAAVLANSLNTQVMPVAKSNDTQYATVQAALTWARSQNPPQGVGIHGEVER